MKIFSKIIFGLSLSAQVFAAPLKVRQDGTITVTEAAVNRLLSRVLTELYVISMPFKRRSVDICSNILYRRCTYGLKHDQRPEHTCCRTERHN
jgi:hypothetical protein